MKLSDIRIGLNSLLAGEMLSMKQTLQHLNYAIDDINTALDACFPTISDISDLEAEYTAIPDKYIRSCVLPGAAHHYYMVDDEGTTPEQNFREQFEVNKFYMLRDYSSQIPEEYQNTDTNIGSVSSDYEDSHGKRGIEGWFTHTIL